MIFLQPKGDIWEWQFGWTLFILFSPIDTVIPSENYTTSCEMYTWTDYRIANKEMVLLVVPYFELKLWAISILLFSVKTCTRPNYIDFPPAQTVQYAY